MSERGTDLASAVGTRTAPVKKRPPRLLLVFDNAAPLEDAGTPPLAIGGEGNGRARGAGAGTRRGARGNDAAETRRRSGCRDAEVARTPRTGTKSPSTPREPHHHAPLSGEEKARVSRRRRETSAMVTWTAKQSSAHGPLSTRRRPAYHTYPVGRRRAERRERDAFASTNARRAHTCTTTRTSHDAFDSSRRVAG